MRNYNLKSIARRQGSQKSGVHEQIRAHGENISKGFMVYQDDDTSCLGAFLLILDLFLIEVCRYRKFPSALGRDLLIPDHARERGWCGGGFLARQLRNYRIFVSASWACRTESGFCILRGKRPYFKPDRPRCPSITGQPPAISQLTGQLPSAAGSISSL